MSKVFRQSALNQLATPEELDKMIQVTNRKGWIAWLGLSSLVLAALVWGIFGSIPTVQRSSGLLIRQDGIQEIKATEAGQLTELNLKAGDSLKTGQVVGKYKTAAGTESELRSGFDGVVLETLSEKGQTLEASAPIVRLEVTARPLQAVLFVPLAEGKRLKPGLPVQLNPSNVRAEEFGYMLGKVSSVSQFPVSNESLILQFKSRELVQALAASGPLIKVEVSLESDPGTPSGFKWSSQTGPRQTFNSGTLCDATLVLSEQRPISLILPLFREESN